MDPAHLTEPTVPAPVLLRADRPRLRLPGLELFADLSFTITPGLTLVRGGDGRGKTSLLRLMAGQLQPDAGMVERLTPQVFLVELREPRYDATVLRAWLQAQHSLYPGWDAALEADLVQAFGLAEHLDKTFHMVSTGTRRKTGLVAAFACGAGLTLLDTPFAALDAASRELLAELLAEAALQRLRAFVLADYALPPGVQEADLSGLIDLGD